MGLTIEATLLINKIMLEFYKSTYCMGPIYVVINIVSLYVVVLNFTMSILKGTFTTFLHLMVAQDQLLKKLHILISNYVMLGNICA
jgi:hypothetical protein